MILGVLAELSGLTRHFRGDGRRLGYPTANIETNTKLSDGVYFGYADLAKYKHQPTLIFIGAPVTLGDKDRRLEAHLLDITDKDYYDEELRVSIHHFHRPNQKFGSVEELLKVMKQDEAAARQWFDKQES